MPDIIKLSLSNISQLTCQISLNSLVRCHIELNSQISLSFPVRYHWTHLRSIWWLFLSRVFTPASHKNLICVSSYRSRHAGKFSLRDKNLPKWTSVEVFQFLTKLNVASKSSSRQRVLDICQQLQDYGYDFNDVTSHWTGISSYNVWEITWATQELLLDHKEVSGCFVLLCRCNCCIIICLSGFILKS